MFRRIVFAAVVFVLSKFSIGQVVEAPKEEDRNHFYDYQFNYSNALKENARLRVGKIDNIKDTLAIFIADSVGFHRWNKFNHEGAVHICENRFRKFGLIGTKNEVLAPFTYDYIQYNEDKSRLVARINNYSGLIDINGKVVIPLEYCKVIASVRNVNILRKNYTDSVLLFYDSLGVYSGSAVGYGPQKLSDKYLSIRNNSGTLKSIVNIQGNTVLELNKYRAVHWIHDEKICVNKDGFCGVIDFNEKVYLPFEYGNIYPGIDKQFIVFKDRKQGVVNSRNKFVIPLDSININYFGSFYITKRVTKNGGLNFINSKGKIFLEGNFSAHLTESRQLDFYTKQFLIVENIDNRLLGLFNDKGKQLLPFEYPVIQHQKGMTSLIIGKSSTKNREYDFALSNLKGEIIVPFSDRYLRFVNGCPNIVTSENKGDLRIAYINTQTGKFITGYDYERDYNNLTGGYAAAKKKFAVALISPEGKLLTEAIYSIIRMIKEEDKVNFSEEVIDTIVCIAYRGSSIYGITNSGEEILQKKTN